MPTADKHRLNCVKEGEIGETDAGDATAIVAELESTLEVVSDPKLLCALERDCYLDLIYSLDGCIDS